MTTDLASGVPTANVHTVPDSLPAAPLAVLMRANQIMCERVGFELGRGRNIPIPELQMLLEECMEQAQQEMERRK